MRRESLPEKVPFRLTRMLVNAMEACGIEGNYRNTCELAVKVIRENKESLIAVLEAFVYDPLFYWMLMTISGDEDTPQTLSKINLIKPLQANLPGEGGAVTPVAAVVTATTTITATAVPATNNALDVADNKLSTTTALGQEEEKV